MGVSAVASKTKTHPGMLHQSQALEATAADKSEDGHETGGGRPARGNLAGNTVEMDGTERSLTAPGGWPAGASVERKFQNRVLVLGSTNHPLMPCHPARARILLTEGRAVTARHFPFTIRMLDRATGATQPVTVKIDPGAKTTGIVVVRTETTHPTQQHVLFAADLTHRGAQIRDALTQRRSFRRSRRGRNLRYRAPRFLNRTKPQGWLPPSLHHRVQTTMTWVTRLRCWAPITGIAVESVRFDLQKLMDPEISGIEYQQGTLQGYEVREYLLEKHGRKCAYCDATDKPLQVEHMHPKSRGGSDRVANLTLACEDCNLDKDNRTVAEYVQDPARAAKIMADAQKPLVSAAAVNATRNALLSALLATGLPVETGTGGQTKHNRIRLGLPKAHTVDAACVGEVDALTHATLPPLQIRCMGRGSHKRTRCTADGFPRGYLSPQKRHHGFRTGDMVRAVVPSGKRKGTHLGRVAVRATGSFNIQTRHGTVQGVSHRFCRLIQPADGYAYGAAQPPPRGFLPVRKGGVSAASF
jgi:5-methylcytosine-specific restriction endonuclease McrA